MSLRCFYVLKLMNLQSTTYILKKVKSNSLYLLQFLTFSETKLDFMHVDEKRSLQDKERSY